MRLNVAREKVKKHRAELLIVQVRYYVMEKGLRSEKQRPDLGH